MGFKNLLHINFKLVYVRIFRKLNSIRELTSNINYKKSFRVKTNSLATLKRLIYNTITALEIIFFNGQNTGGT